MNYKAPDNSLHFIEPEFAHLLPDGSVPITDEEAEVLRPVSQPPAIQSQIDDLERAQLMPRATREFMLLSMESMATPEQLEQNFGYKAVKAFDLQITALRAQL